MHDLLPTLQHLPALVCAWAFRVGILGPRFRFVSLSSAFPSQLLSLFGQVSTASGTTSRAAPLAQAPTRSHTPASRLCLAIGSTIRSLGSVGGKGYQEFAKCVRGLVVSLELRLTSLLEVNEVGTGFTMFVSLAALCVYIVWVYEIFQCCYLSAVQPALSYEGNG